MWLLWWLLLASLDRDELVTSMRPWNVDEARCEGARGRRMMWEALGGLDNLDGLRNPFMSACCSVLGPWQVWLEERPSTG